MRINREKEAALSLHRLKQLLSYDPESGLFTRVKSAGGKKKNQKAGRINNIGYGIVAVDSKEFLAHRLAWFYMTGKWPKDQIDHRDGNKSNNSFQNLREASNSQNHVNMKYGRARSGFRGVKLIPSGRWMVRLGVRGRTLYLGVYDSPEAASQVYRAKSLEIFGDFTPE